MPVLLDKIKRYQRFINQQVGFQFTGAGVHWVDDVDNNRTTPQLYIPPALLHRQAEMEAVVSSFIRMFAAVPPKEKMIGGVRHLGVGFYAQAEAGER